jgi:NADH:ubiquinone oxidoreductase subunit 2 (subunit N)
MNYLSTFTIININELSKNKWSIKQPELEKQKDNDTIVKVLVYYITNLKNYFFNNKLQIIAFLFIFFSFAGIPPFAGFISKIYIVLQFVFTTKWLIAFYLIVCSALATYYYIRVIKISTFEAKLLQLATIFEIIQIQMENNSIKTILYFNFIIFFILLFIFFEPKYLLYLCEYIICHLNTLNF